MLDMDCKGGDCQIRIVADGRLVGKFSDGILNKFKTVHPWMNTWRLRLHDIRGTK